jgi:hypothetical protein
MRAPSSYATKTPAVLKPAMFSIKHTRARIALVFALVALCLLWNLSGIDGTSYIRRPAEQPVPQLPGYDLPGMNDTLVIFRTGSTELENRLTIHLTTSLRLFPNHLIFSDFEENYHGEQILDALADVSVDILENNPDFELYRRLRKGGRAALDPSELAGSLDKFASKSGNVENPGWKLDKWKFLPMVNRTLHERPNMKWYVFVEADSFLFGSRLQQYLATLDATKPIYAGKQMFIANDLFAHGGSGFVVSQPALRTVVDYYTSHKTAIEEFTNGHWAGDVSGMQLRPVDDELT